MTAIEIVALIVHGFDVANLIIKDPVMSAADDVAHRLETIFDAVADAKTGKVTAAEARARIDQLKPADAAIDAIIDARIDAKFPTGSGT
jgi:hypothetical protein